MEDDEERLKSVRGSMKEALGKLTGSNELEAQGALEKGALEDAGTRAEKPAVKPVADGDRTPKSTGRRKAGRR